MWQSEPVLGILPEAGEWEFKEPLTWVSDGLTTTIPAGFITDLASIPRPLRGILDREGDSRFGSLLHDFLYATQELHRFECDEWLRRALIEYGMPSWHARVYWLGVRLGGWHPWNRRLARGGGLQRDDFTSEEAYRLAKVLHVR